MKIYYFDSFTNRVVNRRIKSAPPERYFLIYSTDCGIYTDTYLIPERYSGNRIDFSYTEEDSWHNDYDHWHRLLEAHLNRHGVGQAISKMRLVKRGYPEKEFKEILKEYR